MEREIKGYIKFTEKKAVTRPLEGQEGFVETWSTNENAGDQTFFNYKGRRFRLISRVEKKS